VGLIGFDTSAWQTYLERKSGFSCVWEGDVRACVPSSCKVSLNKESDNVLVWKQKKTTLLLAKIDICMILRAHLVCWLIDLFVGAKRQDATK
jgi:hypothetical protein